MELEKLKYPLGKYSKPSSFSSEKINEWISEIALFPTRLTKLVENLSPDELLWVYRPNGWNIRQVVHHCADSHMNGLIRFKLSLTEDTPTIKPYLEGKWANTADVNEAPIEDSLKIIEGLHSRWAYLLKSLNSEDLKREFIHPEHGKHFSLAEYIGNYAWHSNHHLAHIKQAISHKGNFL